VQLRRLLLFCRNILWFDNTKYWADCNKDFWRNDYWSPVEKCAGKRRTIDADFMHPFSIRSCRLAGSPDWFRYWSIYVRGCPGLPSRPLARPSDFHLLKQRLAALVAICHRRTETETERERRARERAGASTIRDSSVTELIPRRPWRYAGHLSLPPYRIPAPENYIHIHILFQQARVHINTRI